MSLTSAAVQAHAHAVRFYDSDEFLVSTLRDYVSVALDAGEAVIVVATAEHQNDLEASLAAAGVDVAEATEDGRYIALDAADTLDRFMRQGKPDSNAFAQVIGGVLATAAVRGRGVKVFGEMVAILWARGEVTAAIELEGLWNELGETHDFSLLCAYPMSNFTTAASTASFQEVCEAHSHVLPTEGYTVPRSEDDHLRSIAVAEQQVKANEYETEALRKKQRELEAALERVQELDRTRREFVAMVVHDIRSPNAVIGGFLEVLRDNWESFSQDQIQDFLSKGIAGTHQIRRLVNDVLTVARIDSGEFTFELEPFDVAELIYTAVASSRSAVPGRAFEVDVPSHLPYGLGDHGRHLQVLTNLLSNADKFSPSDTSIFVTAARQDDELIVSVRDEGPGISKADMTKLFQRFSRLDNPRFSGVKGTGLGLFICKSLVVAQGGRIWADSELGAGSTFSFSIPVSR